MSFSVGKPDRHERVPGVSLIDVIRVLQIRAYSPVLRQRCVVEGGEQDTTLVHEASLRGFTVPHALLVLSKYVSLVFERVLKAHPDRH